MIPNFTHIDISIQDKVAFAHLNRPNKANALNEVLWFEIEKLAHWVEATPHVDVP